MKKLLLFAAFVLATGSAGAQTGPIRTAVKPVRLEDFSLRTNLLYDALFTPTFGVEWRMSDRWGLKLDGGFSYWGGDRGRRHDLWLVNPEVRRYVGRGRQFYLGAGANVGGYDIYELGPVAAAFPDRTGYDGVLYNAGLVAGYQRRLSRSLSLELSVGLGYTYLNYGSYTMGNCETCFYKEYKQKDATKNFFGPTQAGLSLIWRLAPVSRNQN